MVRPVARGTLARWWAGLRDRSGEAERGKPSAYARWRAQGVKIGVDCAIYEAFLDPLCPFLIEIGDRVIMSGGVAVLAHDAVLMGWRRKQRFARVRILDDCFIGHRAMIMPGVTIGPRSVVAAGAIVTKDVPADTIVAGNPARVLTTLPDYLARIDRDDFVGKLVDIPWVGVEDPGYAKHRAFMDRELRRLADEGFFG
jgi:acetyltransferase-like isoleucine patch superfamily enzyme